MKCLQPRRIMKNLDPVKFPMGLMVPCGQCMNCRLQKREEWALRLIHESESWKECIFLTLTYSDEYLPENESVVKEDLQKFFKRLRKRLGKRDIKYFASGEYGEDKDRPHYHCIIFGLDYLSMEDREIIKDAWQMCDWDMLGDKPFGDVTIQSIRYTLKYIEKDIVGKEEKYAYEVHNIEKPFHLMSKGLGKAYALSNVDTIQEGKIRFNGFTKSVPRYYSTKTGSSRESLQEFAREKEIQLVESVIGVKATRDEIYLMEKATTTMLLEGAIKQSNIQHDLNLKARALNKQKKK